MSSPSTSLQPAGRRGLPALDPALLWRGDAMAQAGGHTVPSGYPALDAELPGGGWPAQGLTELLLAHPGIGELRLLAPVLRSFGNRPVLWIAPPATPYLPALQQLGLSLDGLVWLTPASLIDAAWAAEQALRSRACAAVLWWSDAPAGVWRRLHLAAQDSGCPLWAMRPLAARGQASAAPLRLAAEAAAGGQLAVQVFKRRGPAMAAPVLLTLPLAAPLLRRSVMPAPEVAHAVAGAAPALVAA
ncbi:MULTISPECIES: translesion DNA synthesis-associated protein ImuA [Aquincola]|uniref:translesion DNA synthesis-associated protein ImuA n=1 Tax=Aquincola TaxID=391952 RepID=UPI00069903AE|nr:MULTISPECIES: translesion DNA synthesis-associated protein ImuA [Aquincola]MCR5866151.1 translesion DNA synthesis-associated protein ImuA [Aquincola sp. J276]